MSLLERTIETKVTEYAQERGCLALKLNVIGRRGWPDRLYLFHGPKILFVEFKRAGEAPRKLQEYIHGILRKYGCRVEMVDSIEQGRALVDDFAQSSNQL